MTEADPLLQPNRRAALAALERCRTVADVHALAAESLDRHVLQMINGGAGSGASIDRNSTAFDNFTLRPRVLSGVMTPVLTTSILGVEATAPLMIAPTGMHGLTHPDGERATASAARRAGLPMVISTHASVAVEDVATTGVDLWFQLYWGRDREAVRDLIQRAETAGCRALCLTLDMPTRPWLSIAMREAVAAIAHAKPAHGTPRSAHLDSLATWDHDASLSWRDLDWLRGQTRLPIVLKGIMTGEDAALAVDHGAAIIVSNHGGRVLERSAATIEVLAEIVSAVQGRCEIYLDGGVRRGSDVVIALALGATAVLIGRPAQWGLAAGGEDGVVHVLELLKSEYAGLLMMLGVSHSSGLSSDHIRSRW